MWKVYEAKTVTKDLKKAPKHIQQKYKAWVEVVKNGGSKNLNNYPDFKDEALKGELRKCRSSRLNIQYRVIYSEDKRVMEIYALKATPHKHDEVLR